MRFPVPIAQYPKSFLLSPFSSRRALCFPSIHLPNAIILSCLIARRAANCSNSSKPTMLMLSSCAHRSNGQLCALLSLVGLLEMLVRAGLPNPLLRAIHRFLRSSRWIPRSSSFKHRHPIFVFFSVQMRLYFDRCGLEEHGTICSYPPPRTSFHCS